MVKHRSSCEAGNSGRAMVRKEGGGGGRGPRFGAADLTGDNGMGILHQILQSFNLEPAFAFPAAAMRQMPRPRRKEQPGERQNAVAAPQERPLEVCVLIDTSSAMAGEKIRCVHEGVKALLEELRPIDRVTVVVFGARATELGRRRMGPDEAKRVLNEQPRCGGSAALFEAIQASINGLQDLKKERRQVPFSFVEFVVICGGQDATTPRNDVQRAASEARERLAKPGLANFNCTFLAVGSAAQNAVVENAFDRVRHVRMERVQDSGDAIKRAFRQLTETISQDRENPNWKPRSSRAEAAAQPPPPPPPAENLRNAASAFSFVSQSSNDFELLPIRVSGDLSGDMRKESAYRFAEAQFLRFAAKTGTAYTVTQVDVVHNRELEAKYEEFKAANRAFFERLVFHGTAEQNIESIARNGFRIGGVDGHPLANGAALGNGVYCSEDPAVAASYIRGSKRLLLCTVAVTPDCVQKGSRDAIFSVIVAKNKAQIIPRFVVHF
jgi:uncharacterized protein YegL